MGELDKAVQRVAELESLLKDSQDLQAAGEEEANSLREQLENTAVDLNADIERLSKENKQLRQNSGNSAGDTARLSAELEAKSAENGALKEKLATTEVALKEAQASAGQSGQQHAQAVETLTADRARLEQEVAKAKQEAVQAQQEAARAQLETAQAQQEGVKAQQAVATAQQEAAKSRAEAEALRAQPAVAPINQEYETKLAAAAAREKEQNALLEEVTSQPDRKFDRTVQTLMEKTGSAEVVAAQVRFAMIQRDSGLALAAVRGREAEGLRLLVQRLTDRPKGQ